MIRSGRVAARSIIEATLHRIERLDGSINAYRVVMAESAMATAARIDALSDGDHASLPLAGVPVAIKDDTDVEGQVTAWGSKAHRGICSLDSEVVARLRGAGAVIIGKTNVPELTLWPWTASKRWGVTRNAWAPERTPGGSSGGSAAAVCTGMAAIALGSDGGGSVRYPAGLTGLVGVKPQRDRVPIGPEHNSGWYGLLVLGPLARSVRDAALFLDVVSEDRESSTFRDVVIARPERLRIAISTNPPPGTQVSLSTTGRGAVEITSELLIGLGHDVVEVDINYGLASLWNSTVRLLKGVRDDAASLPDRGDLERRTRAVARLGAVLPSGSLPLALRRERTIAASINAVFDDARRRTHSPVRITHTTGRRLPKRRSTAIAQEGERLGMAGALERDRTARHRHTCRNRPARPSHRNSARRARRRRSDAPRPGQRDRTHPPLPEMDGPVQHMTDTNVRMDSRVGSVAVADRISRVDGAALRAHRLCNTIVACGVSPVSEQARDRW